MKRTCAVLLLSVPFFALAQKKATVVLKAEKSFAAYSVQNGTKAAFLKFADSNAVIFEKGKAVNAIETWNKREARPGVLNWHPVYGILAASGDLGFTTGPWTFQPKTLHDSIVARGQYNTVWHKTVNGEWKFLVDMGVSNTPNFEEATFRFSDKKIAFTPGTLADLRQAEEAFVQHTQDATGRTKAYTEAVSKHAFLLNRNGRLPTTAITGIETLMATLPQPIAYQPDGSGISKSGDLGYVYGTVLINGKENNYLRIWRREGTEWKLVLEVLPY